MIKVMSAQTVIALLKLCALHDITVVVDGGWGVDALLGRQTRPHADLDIALEHKDVPQLRAILAEQGYTEIPRDDSRECNFVLADDKGHEIDVHSYTFDEHKKIIFGVPYPYESLQGTGTINGYSVRCIPPDWMVKFHTGYPLDENDYRDLKALCEQFDIALPPEFEPFLQMPL